VIAWIIASWKALKSCLLQHNSSGQEWRQLRTFAVYHGCVGDQTPVEQKK
jgi:hypothetical protein